MLVVRTSFCELLPLYLLASSPQNGTNFISRQQAAASAPLLVTQGIPLVQLGKMLFRISRLPKVTSRARGRSIFLGMEDNLKSFRVFQVYFWKPPSTWSNLTIFSGLEKSEESKKGGEEVHVSSCRLSCQKWLSTRVSTAHVLGCLQESPLLRCLQGSPLLSCQQ